jgi:hypothetical protein
MSAHTQQPAAVGIRKHLPTAAAAASDCIYLSFLFLSQASAAFTKGGIKLWNKHHYWHLTTDSCPCSSHHDITRRII